MTSVELLTHLRSLNVRLWVNGDRLCYSAPDGVLTPDLLARLKERKAEIVSFLSQARASVQIEAQDIEPRPRGQYPPLSYAQQRLWFLHQLQPDSAAYAIPLAVRLRGGLNIAALAQSFNEIIRRHEALRTTFGAVDGRPFQIISQSCTATLPLVYLGSSPIEREEMARRLATQETHRPFDLAGGPLFRGVIFRLDDEDHIVLLTVHHINFDGWSRGILVQELATLYRAFLAGLPAPLTEVRAQYADYAAWQQELLKGEVLSSHLSYWRQQLGGDLPVLELPVDRPRPATHTYRGATHPLVIPESQAAALKELSQKEGATLFMTVLAAFKVWLSRYAAHEDIIVGTPVAGRNRAEIEPLIGLFVNTIVLRASLAGNPSFRELLSRISGVVLGAFTYQDLPFEKLVEELQPERDLGRNPLFQVMFSLQNASPAQFELPGLRVSAPEFDREAAQFDLELGLAETQVGLSGSFEYDSALFDAATIRRMAEHFGNLLEAIVNDPDRHILGLPVLGEAEAHQLLVEWNDSQTSCPEGLCLDALFESQVDRTPDAIAAAYENEQITYRELNSRANRLARVLEEWDVKPEVVVAVLAPRGLDLLIAMMAIFKAGGVYLPLDPFHPPSRRAQTLRQSGSPLVLISGELQTDALPESGLAERQAEMIRLDDPRLQDKPDHNPPSGCAPLNLAYVIYTSGSTGVPKGAMVDHSGMINHLFAKIRDLHLSQDDIVAQTASQCFDISIWQFLAPLLVGGRVCVIGDEIARDPSRLAETVEREAVSVLETVPSLLNSMLSDGQGSGERFPGFPALRWLVVTGEALPPELCRLWLSIYPQTPMVNAYGPTECSDDVTHCALDRPPKIGASNTPIGRPVANMQIYSLDKMLRPVAIGAPGEIYVGGAGVGRGYLNNGRQTAEVFVPDPFASEPGQRLYRTGDLGRYLPDGDIEFLCRVDHQVKIRGFRIELGEIEAVLTQHPVVQQAIVLASESGSGGRRLVAYVVVGRGHEAPPGELRRFVKERLPDYMVPAAFVILNDLPLTPNGKIDRRALPPPDSAASESEHKHIAPRTPAEEKLAAIWRDVLGAGRVGVLDNFFELGGHSLLATQVISRIRAAFGIELPLRVIFETPTVAELVSALERSSNGQEGPPAPTIQPMSRGGRNLKEMLMKVGELSDSDAVKLLREKGMSRRRLR